jgi:hypothetical protein
LPAQEVPGKQTAVVSEAAVRAEAQGTARLREGGEDELALEDIRKEFPAQQMPKALRSNIQPVPSREASCAAHPDEPMEGKASDPHTITNQGSIMPTDKKLCGDKEGKGAATGPCPRIQWSSRRHQQRSQYRTVQERECQD